LNTRRRILTGLISFTAGLFSAKTVHAAKSGTDNLRFPGDPTDHNVIFQFNSDDLNYQKAVLFSVGELLRKHEDNITIVVTVFGKGIHILAKKPLREVSDLTKQRVNSLADYGVKFHACGNTMNSLGWTKDDMLPFVEVIKVGASDLIEHQEKGYSYISW
jgi:uncharacterized protein